MTTDVLMVVGRNEQILAFCNGSKKVLGYEPREVIGRRLGVLIPDPCSASLIRNHVRLIGDARRPQDCARVWMRHKRGHSVPAHVVVSRRGTHGYRIAFRVITQQQHSSAERRLLSDLADLLDSALDERQVMAGVAALSVKSVADFCALALTNDDGTVRHLTMASTPSFGKRRATTVHTLLTDPSTRPAVVAQLLENSAPVALPRPDRPATLGDAMLADFLDQIGPRAFIATALRSRQKRLGVMILIPAMPRGDDDVERRYTELIAKWSSMAIEQVNALALARQALEQQHEVMATVAHDIRGPLGVVSMWIELMAGNVPEGQRERRLSMRSNRALNSLQRINRLAEALLTVVAGENNGLSIDRRPESLSTLIADTAAELRPSATAQGVQLLASVPTEMCVVSCDRDRIIQVVVNLIDNAIKFTPTGGTIELSLTEQVGSVRCAFRDTGRGMDGEQTRHVFERFWRARRSACGAGLGLAICKRIIEAHEGAIWIESSEPNMGTTFVFTLPRA